jgi:multidrug efflux pump subunit AcrB
MTNELENNEESNDIALDENNLGIAGRITRQFINSPVTPLLMGAFLVIGLLGLFFTPRQEDPQISVPMVDIFFKYPGASAGQVASLATNPLERLISEIPGIRHVYSASSRGQGMVTARFEVGEDLGESIVKVHDKIQSNIDKVPPGVSMPLVKPVGADDVPVITITLWSQDEGIDDSILRTLGLDVLQRLEEVPDTGKGFVVGGRAEQIRVEVSPERLSGFGISVQEIANTIQTANSEQSTGHVEGGNLSFHVYSGGFLRTAHDVSNLVVAIRHGAPVYVRDVAWVYEAPAETDKMVTYSTGAAYTGDTPEAFDAPAVTIAIAKKIGTNGVSVANEILEKLESLKGHIIPDNIEVSITRNYGASANAKVNELLLALFEATVAVSFLCLIGLGLRAAFVVICVIPVVILMTVWATWVIDYTIDRVSLFALVFTIGILVDDATVVVENIFRRWLQAGRTSTNIAIDAVREVGNPTILATLAIISALMAMGFVSGMMGPYMRPIPVLGSIAMFLSLIAAFIFVPWFAMRLRPKLEALERAEAREAKMANAIGAFYTPIMRPLCQNPIIGYVFLFSLIGATFLSCYMFATQAVTVKMLPFDNKPEFNVVINMPEGTALPITANVTSQVAAKLREMPEVMAIQTYAGTSSPFNFNGMVRHYYLRQQPWQADIQVMLLDKDDRERQSHEIAVDARSLITQIVKDAGGRVAVVEMPPGPPVLQTVVTEIYGPDAETRRQVASDMVKIFEEAEGIVDVDSYMAQPYDYWRFEVDTKKAARRGISVDSINKNLAMVMGGYQLGDVKKGMALEPTYIVIQAPIGSRSQINRLGNMPIISVEGESIPLTELGRFVKVAEDPIVYHQDLRPVEYVTGEMTGRLGAPIYGMFDVEALLDTYETPDGVVMTGMPMGLLGPPDDDFQSGFEWGGEWTVTYETFRDMCAAFMVAMLAIYGLIVWEFKNFTIGGLIMAPIPLTLIGIIPGHWFANAEFTATSMIGFIALAGIVVRNSILLVEFVKHEVECGKDIEDAVIDAGKARMRPIVITALTLMAGAYMILDDLIFKGMAVSLLYGAGVATVLTLVVIPRGCISIKKHFFIVTDSDGLVIDYDNMVPEAPAFKLPLWMRMYSGVVNGAMWVFYTGRMVLMMIRMGFDQVMNFISPPPPPPPPPKAPPPPPPKDSGPDGSGSGGAGSGGSGSGGANTAEKPATTEAKPGSEKTVEKTNESNVDIAQEADKTDASVSTNIDGSEEENTSVQETQVKETVEKQVSEPVVKKKSAPKKKVKKKAAAKKKAADKPAPQKRRGIRLKTGFENE